MREAKIKTKSKYNRMWTFNYAVANINEYVVSAVQTVNISARAKQIEKKHGHSHSRLYLYPNTLHSTLPLYAERMKMKEPGHRKMHVVLHRAYIAYTHTQDEKEKRKKMKINKFALVKQKHINCSLAHRVHSVETTRLLYYEVKKSMCIKYFAWTELGVHTHTSNTHTHIRHTVNLVGLFSRFVLSLLFIIKRKILRYDGRAICGHFS